MQINKSPSVNLCRNIAILLTNICQKLTHYLVPIVVIAPIASIANENNKDLLNLSLEELMSVKVSVASNVISDARTQPVSVTTINKDKIGLSGARTLNELLSIFVPGYFLVEDQDDTIAGFRGLVPDNNSKTMLLLNGIPLNTEWFWGAPDSILNGIDLNFIERIEVIRGPGSVTLGQGAMLGVIDIITKKNEVGDVHFEFSVGENGFKTTNLSGNFQTEDTYAYAYFSTGQYDGQQVRNEGWAMARSDQGLTVFERQHHLKRSEFTNFLANVKYKQFDLDLYHFEQVRDLYNFYRDREVVSQTLDGMAAHYNYQLNKQVKAKITGYYAKDDYGLSSHGLNIETQGRLDYESQGSGFSDIINDIPELADSAVTPGLLMGGTRETRQGIKLLLNWDEIIPNNNLAFGAEYTKFNYGKKDSLGNNFIINEEIQRLGLASDGNGGFTAQGSVNENNAWVKPGSISISSFFMEDFHQVNDSFSLFAAFRYDNHPDWGSKISPRIGGFYDIDNVHLFRATWQTGFRGAVGVQFSGGFVQDGFLAQDNFDSLNNIAETEADFDFDGIASNDTNYLSSVEPETIESFELAYSYSDKSLKFEGVVFYSVVKDILAAQANGYETLAFGEKIGTDDIGTWNGNWYYQNQLGQLDQFGYELELTYQWHASQFSLSHAHVEVAHADKGTIGEYVLDNEKNSAYPSDITRFHMSYPLNFSVGSFLLQYNHLYYWDYYAPTGLHMDGNGIANIGIAWSPPGKLNNIRVNFVVKNIWDSNALYPINGTGDRAGADGTPALEARTWWFSFNFDF